MFGGTFTPPGGLNPPKIDINDQPTLRQRMDNGISFNWHFDQYEDSILNSYSWAGGVFATPTNVNISIQPSLMYLRNSTGARSYLYNNSIPLNTSYLKCFFNYVPNGKYGFIGIRYDDGTDLNFLELGLYTLGNRTWKHRIYHRTGGGVEVVIDDPNIITLPESIIHRTVQYGTKWTNWGCNLDLILPWQAVNIFPIMNKGSNSGKAWTPARFGIILRSDDEVIVGLEAFGVI